LKWTYSPHRAILDCGDQTIKEEDTMTEDKTETPTTTSTKPPIANMDETDWATMLMEMRILSA
jgi:hypothetical protein